MTRFRAVTIAGLLVATAAAAVPAAAAQGPIARRNAGLYEVTPAMMHAINVIVAEKSKMARRRR